MEGEMSSDPPKADSLVEIVREAVREDMAEIKAEEKKDEAELSRLLTKLDLMLIPLTVAVIWVLAAVLNLGEIGVLTQPCGMAVARVVTRKVI